MAGYKAHEKAVFEGAPACAYTCIWHVFQLMPSCHMGYNCIPRKNVLVACGVALLGGVLVGDAAVFTDVIHPQNFISRNAELKHAFVGRHTVTGANAILLRNVPDGLSFFR